MANAASKKKTRNRIILIALAAIGVFTVTANIVTLGSELYSSVKVVMVEHDYLPSFLNK